MMVDEGQGRTPSGESVYLTEKSGGLPSEVLGIFSSPQRAREVCQESANEYFGAGHTDLLKWVMAADGGYSSASYYHPGAGMNYLFQVTRYTVDELYQP